MNVVLRGYRAGDAELLAALYRDSVMTLGALAYSPTQLVAWARYPDDVAAFDAQLRAGELRVAVVDGVPAAFGLLEEMDHVALIYCRAKYSRQGLASRILGELELLSRAAGQVVLHTDASRISKPFFMRHEYRQTGCEEVQRDGVWLQRFHLMKLLVEPTATRWLILGNSASGKSTMARRIATAIGGGVLDLDTIAWQRDCALPQRRPAADGHAEIDAFMRQNPAWVIEGCYEDLIAHAAGPDTVLVFLDPAVEVCLARAVRREFEPHKFATPEEQMAALGFLKHWIAEYPVRSGPMSREAHLAVFNDHPGPRYRCGDPGESRSD